MKSLEQKIIVRCKNCGWRIFDKVTMTTGVIELKCPNCHRVVEVAEASFSLSLKTL